MKNFSTLLNVHQQQIANPFLYTTPQVEQEIQLGMSGKITNLLIGSSIATILTAPLQTIVTSMQLSVLPHKEIFATVESRTKELAKLNTELTIAEKRKLQLMIRSGGEFQPYVAPVYQGYQQAIRNLAKQGWQAFFKGLSFRLIHNVPHFFCYGAFMKNLTSQDSNRFGFVSFMTQSLAFLFVADWSFNMFHVLQNRYILQNNIKQFRVFRNVFRVMGKMITRGELWKGVSYHGWNAVVELCLKFPVFLVLATAEKFTPEMYYSYYLAEFLLYPLQTAYKRFVCQSTAIPGMIPVRYSTIGHALKVIAFEEKIKGLYRGFGLHSVSVVARLAVLQAVFQNLEVVEKGEF